MKKSILVSIQQSDIDSFWRTRIMDGINSYASERRLSVKQIHSRDIVENQHIILIGTDETWLINETKSVEAHGGIPVLVNATIPGVLSGRHSTRFALDRAMRDAVRYLSSIGTSKMAIVATSNNSAADRLKRRTFLEETSNLSTIQEALVFDCNESGIIGAVESFMDNFEQAAINGVICANDITAILLIAKLTEHGVKVGAEFPVIGFGNTHVGERFLPSLTTIDFDYYKMGREAARLYGYVSKQPAEIKSTTTITLFTELTIRASTGNISFSCPATKSTKYEYTNMYTSAEIEKLVRLENYLQCCDPIDRELIFGAHESYSNLEEVLFASERTLKYRMSRILNKLSFNSKNELASFINSFTQTTSLKGKKSD